MRLTAWLRLDLTQRRAVAVGLRSVSTALLTSKEARLRAPTNLSRGLARQLALNRCAEDTTVARQVVATVI